MNRTALQNHGQAAQYLIEQRGTLRYEMVHLITVTDRGTGKIINISEHGMAFGCLYPHTFEDRLFLDILDAYGTHIVKIPVRKVWERRSTEEGLSEEFDLEVGVEFIELTGHQRSLLKQLLELASPYQAQPTAPPFVLS